VTPPPRILLADADAFFAAVARLVDPDGAGKSPLLIVGGSRGSRGVVCSASWEARQYGVRSAMSIARAEKLCPNAMFVPVPGKACSIKNKEIRAVLQQIPDMTLQVNRALVKVELMAERASSAIDSLQLQFSGSTTEMAATLQALRQTLEEMYGLLSTDSGLGYGLQEALASFRDAVDALRLLTTSLEQNPDMLIRGKKPPEK